jgi:hypothetical protein
LQRLADSWRSSIGSAALSVIIAYFEAQDDLRESDEKRAAFAEIALDKLRFCYKKADGDDEDVSFYLVCILYIHINNTQRRIFADFIKVPLLFKILVNTSLRSTALKIYLAFMMKMPSPVVLSHYQSQQ